ncbi:3D domain-containing protein [Patescibacteria group bacterium]|nr:3D domain-containing protein [Patescibacteria group bacterium]MBU2579576.1 3D domain-containing protein [Patescibacteria group bacterium]
MYTKNRISVSLSLLGLVSNFLFPQLGLIGPNQTEIGFLPVDGLITLQGQTLVQSSTPDTPIVVNQKWVTVTAYSSTPDQTDSTPFITASGTGVRDGIIACNFLKFGTRVRFPDIYGDKVFVVEDRMALKNNHKIDIWFETREDAKQFGVQQLKVEVLKI